MKNQQSEVTRFVDKLGFGKANALTSEVLYTMFTALGWTSKSIEQFRRECRSYSAAARKEGIRVIGNENGYYLAVNNEEWFD